MDRPNSTVDRAGLRSGAASMTALGVFLVVLGFIAGSMAFVTTVTSTITIGLLMLVGGLFQLVHAFTYRGGAMWRGFLSGLLYGLAGFAFLARPLAGAAALTLLLASLFVAGGIFRAIAAVSDRYQGWGWGLVSGLASIFLGVVLLAEWPQASLWLIGLFVGIDLVIIGVDLIAAGWATRRFLREWRPSGAMPPGREERPAA